MADETSGLSRSVEDYLKVIYSLCEPGEVASTSAISDALEVQPASVTGMVKRLAESGYLEHVPYRGVQLTEAGTRAALRILRRHRVLESYLTERLGYRWEDVHQEPVLTTFTNPTLLDDGDGGWDEFHWDRWLYARGRWAWVALKAHRWVSGRIWAVLRALYWVGVIDTAQAVKFRWSDVWRIRPGR